ncbi:MAG: ATPase, partial [Planctomycetes bacterium]|nr:ATPase [Planctomycetota bacterium]
MTAPEATTKPRFAETREFLDQIRTRVGKVVVGQDVVVERVLIALLTSGHLLLQGVPGLAKTLLVAAV